MYNQHTIASPISATETDLVPVKLHPSMLLAPWLAKKVKAGYGGTYKEIEALAATLQLGEERALDEIPAPWHWEQSPKECYLTFAQQSKLQPEEINRYWVQVANFLDEHPHPFQSIVAARPLADIKAEVEQARRTGQPINTTAKEEKVSNATRLHRLVDAQCEVWQTPDRQAWVDVPIGNHHESMPLESKPFKMWLSEQFYRAHDRYIGQDALSQVLCVLAGKAMQAEEFEIHHRSALVDGKVYLDLGRKDWKIVEVSDTGWRIVTHCPAKFWRPNSMKALPLPIAGGDWRDLKQILNLEEADWVLLLTWLSFGFFPQTPHPLLILNGEQGTGKSKASELLKRLIDPSKALLMSLPRDERNLKAHAANRSVLVYDNLSGLSNEMSDALCRLATGGGLVDRMLYSDMEESVFDGVRPIVLNGIEALASRPDLLERSVLFNLPVITDDQRITEAQWERTLTEIQPAVLGCLLSAVAQGLAHKDNLHLMSLPRMADFAVWGHAVEGAFGFAPGSFEQAYSKNRCVVHDAALDNDLVASAIRDLIAIRGEWTGTATELMIELTKLLPEQVTRSPEWIRSPRGLGRRLPRLAPELRRAGIEVKTGIKIGGQRVITIGKVPEAEPVIEEAPIEVGEAVVFANGCYPDLIFTVVELIGSMLKVQCPGYQEATYPSDQMRRHQPPKQEALAHA